MTLSHLVITRFSYRGKDVFKHVTGPRFHSIEDPLNPKRLDLRFKLFELACLPSVLAQAEQGFSWIILVDRELPADCLARLRSLVRARKHSFIHAFDPQSDLGSLGWLRPYLPEGVDRVATTNLDDDDSLPTRFVTALQRRLRDLDGAGRLPPIGVIGARQIVEWDLLPSNDAPLGWKAPWHRRASVASAGLSLCCSVPSFDFCVLGLRHALAEAYLDFSTGPVHPNVIWLQRAVLAAAQKAGVDPRTWGHNDLFYDISQDVGPVLMTNHTDNDQPERLFESKRDRTVVTGPADFPDLPINWEKARSYARAFSAPGPEDSQQG
jgi:hypothetical protein